VLYNFTHFFQTREKGILFTNMFHCVNTRWSCNTWSVKEKKLSVSFPQMPDLACDPCQIIVYILIERHDRWCQSFNTLFLLLHNPSSEMCVCVWERERGERERKSESEVERYQEKERGRDRERELCAILTKTGF